MRKKIFFFNLFFISLSKKMINFFKLKETVAYEIKEEEEFLRLFEIQKNKNKERETERKKIKSARKNVEKIDIFLDEQLDQSETEQKFEILQIQRKNEISLYNEEENFDFILSKNYVSPFFREEKFFPLTDKSIPRFKNLKNEFN